MDHRVIHFEIPADDPQAAIEFYGGVFGWGFTQFGDMPYWTIETGEGAGIDGGLMPKNGPDHPVTNVINVDDVETYCAKIEAAGGIVVVPKMAIPGIGYCAYFKDPSGNIMGVYHSDRTAS